MIITYQEALEKYGSKYKLLKALEKDDIFKIDKGYYSDTEYYSKVEYIMRKFPKCIFTNQSAFLYLGFSDYIPDLYYIATNRNSKRIPLNDVRQTYESDKYYGLGKTSITVNGIIVNIYNKERMLIELMRNYNTLPFDYYKEIIGIYREKIDEIDMDKLMDYLEVFNNNESILEKLNREVF